MTICAAMFMAGIILLPHLAIAQNTGSVGIGLSNPDASAILDAASTTKGALEVIFL